MNSPTYKLPPTSEQLLEELLAQCADHRRANCEEPVPRELRCELPFGTDATYLLSAPDSCGRPPMAVLKDRHSIRNFAGDPLPAGVLAAVLMAMAGYDRRTASAEVEAGNGLAAVSLVRDVTGVEPGVYAVGAHGNRLDRCGALDSEVWQSLFFPPQLGTARVLVLLVGSVAASWYRGGAPEHMRLMRRAGSAAYAGWLAALGHGHDGCLIGGTRPSAPLDKAARFGPVNRQPLIALALGRQAGAG